jgi:hypothetical protein
LVSEKHTRTKTLQITAEKLEQLSLDFGSESCVAFFQKVQDIFFAFFYHQSLDRIKNYSM